MNKFLYVFNDDLAKKLDSIGYKTYSQEKREDGESYKLYAEDRNLSPKEIGAIFSLTVQRRLQMNMLSMQKN